MTTPTTDALMALADRYAFHIPGSQHSDEARAALLAALQEQAREGVAVAIKDAVGCVLEGWTLPDPVRKILETAYYAAPQPAQPSEPAQPEQGEQRYISIERVEGFPSKLEDGPQPVLYSDSINGCMVRRDDVWLALTSQLQSAQPVAQPLTDEQIDAFWNQQLTVPQIVQRRVIARAIEAAHGIGGAL